MIQKVQKYIQFLTVYVQSTAYTNTWQCLILNSYCTHSLAFSNNKVPHIVEETNDSREIHMLEPYLFLLGNSLEIKRQMCDTSFLFLAEYMIDLLGRDKNSKVNGAGGHLQSGRGHHRKTNEVRLLCCNILPNTRRATLRWDNRMAPPSIAINLIYSPILSQTQTEKVSESATFNRIC